MMKFTKTVLMFFCALWLFGCQGLLVDDEGNSRINIGDGKLFGSETAYVWGVTAAQYAVYKNPMLGFSVKRELGNTKEKLAELEKEYPAAQAVDIALAELRKQCGWWCNSVAGEKYLNTYIDLAENIKSDLDIDVLTTPQTVIDKLIAQIEAIEGSVPPS